MNSRRQHDDEASDVADLERVTSDDGDVAVAVFAPALLLTIEIHRNSDDRTDVHLHAGGQGYWVSRMIQALGVRAIPCGAVGGEPGEALRAIIAADGLEARLTPMSTPNAVIIDDRRDGEPRSLARTDIQSLGRHDVDELYSSIVGAAMRAGVCVLTGTQLAPMFDTDTFRRLVTDLKHNDITVVADLCGEPLRAALAGGVDVLKLSHEEFIADGWASSSGVDAITSGIERLRGAGAAAVVVSRSDRSTVVGFEDELVEVKAPSLEVLDGRGGGDSMTAALAVAAAHGMAFTAGLRLAAAAGALNVSRHGLGTGRRDSIEEIAEHVEIRPVKRRGASSPAPLGDRANLLDETKQELYERARELEIPQRSKMTRDELISAIDDAIIGR
ncbi:PfkB family carbohydrate kinase [Ilumatobacter nonamiensis]|uniref:PfkB family carbohydrate kinase n=1 Tax=Ilumatobacter nonamiensis TaxID=467093 RepID=UPI0011D2205D|nr:PfkB family carbohydrate kinase [Ilumatobacter nonamiensis]